MDSSTNAPCNEEQATLRKVLPEIALIAWLLILPGMAKSIGAMVSFREIASQFTHQNHMSTLTAYTIQMMVLEITGFVLSLAGLIVGIGLLRVMPWARRGAIVLLFATMAFSCMSVIFDNLRPNNQSMGEVIRYATYFLPILHSSTLLVFVLSLRMRQEWDTLGKPGLLTEIAERFLRWLPRKTTPLAALVALLFLYWACIELRPSWEYLSRSGGDALSASLVRRIILCLSYAVAGFGLLWRKEWAGYLGIVALSASIIFRAIQLLSKSTMFPLQQHESLIMIVVYFISMLLNISGDAIIIDFLARSWQRPLPSTDVDRLLCDEEGSSVSS